MELKDRIVQKAIELRNLSNNTDLGIDFDNPPKIDSIQDIEKFLKNNKGITEMKNKSTKIMNELFSLLDELDVVEGRGIQR
jgi:hypothetical protein